VPGTYTHEHLAAFKSLEGYNFFTSGHVQTVMSYKLPLCQCRLQYLSAKVIPSQRVSKKPYDAWVCVDGNGTVKCAHCTCMAGLGQVCVHIAAVLFKVEAAVKLGFTKRSSTSEACKWNTQFRKEVEMMPVSEMGHLIKSSRKTTVPSINPTSSDELPSLPVLQFLQQCCPDAVFFTTLPKLDDDDTDTAEEDELSCFFPMLTSIGNYTLAPSALNNDDLVKSYREACTTAKIERLEVETREQRDSFLWHMHRKGRITGTSVHDVMRQTETSNKRTLVSKIMGYSSIDLSSNKAVNWGIQHEAVALEQYRTQHISQHSNATVVRSGLLVDKFDVFLGVSADAVIVCPECGRGVVEIKCPFKHRFVSVFDAAATDKDFCLTADGTLKSTHRYYSQIMLQMHIHQVTFCDFVVFTNVHLHVTRITLDTGFVNNMLEKCRHFWFGTVLHEIRHRAFSQDRLPDQESICICRRPQFGRCITCASPDCKISTFHYACVGIEVKPKGQWICESCR